MKPTVRSTAIAFLVIGAAALVFGLTGFPKPTALFAGGAAVLAGIGLFLRVRRAWTLGAAYAVASLGFAGFRLWRALTGDEISMTGVTLAAVGVAVALYLLVSLLAIRARYSK